MAESFDQSQATHSEESDIVGPYAKWPPEPPIGKLPVEQLHLRSVGGEAEKEYLYLLLRGRYGLTKEDLFKTVPNKTVWDERTTLKAFILSLEGWSDAKIEIELNNGFSGLNQQRNEFATQEYFELIGLIKHKTIRWHSLLMPQTTKESGELYSAAENMEAMEKTFNNYLAKKYPNAHRTFPRTKIFLYGNPHLPSPHGTGFANTNNMLLLLRKWIVDRQKPTEITETIGHRIAEESSREMISSNSNIAGSLRSAMHRMLSKEARELLKEMGLIQRRPVTAKDERKKRAWPDERRVAIATQLATPGVRYGDVERSFKLKTQALNSVVTSIGIQILKKLKEGHNPEWEPWMEKLSPVSAFLAYYTDIGFESAINRAQEIQMMRGKKYKQNLENDEEEREGE